MGVVVHYSRRGPREKKIALGRNRFLKIKIRHTMVTIDAARATVIEDIGPKELNRVKEMLVECLDCNTTSEVRVGGQKGEDGFFFEAEKFGQLLLCFLLEKDSDKGSLLLRFGVAPFDNEEGRALWDTIVTEDLNPDPPDAARAPWSASSFTKKGYDIKNLQWVLRFEEVVAWAWLSILADKTDVDSKRG